MYALRDLLGDALASLVGPRRARQAAVLDAWAQVVGDTHARHAKAVGIRGRALIVATDLPALYYELGLRRAALVDALNERAGGDAIAEIQIVMRPLDRSSGEESAGGR